MNRTGVWISSLGGVVRRRRPFLYPGIGRLVVQRNNKARFPVSEGFLSWRGS